MTRGDEELREKLAAQEEILARDAEVAWQAAACSCSAHQREAALRGQLAEAVRLAGLTNEALGRVLDILRREHEKHVRVAKLAAEYVTGDEIGRGVLRTALILRDEYAKLTEACERALATPKSGTDTPPGGTTPG